MPRMRVVRFLPISLFVTDRTELSMWPGVSSTAVIQITRFFDQIRSFSTKRRRYQAAEVRPYLRGRVKEETDPEIQRAVERLPTFLRDPQVRRRYDGFQRYFDVLPRIIFLYNRGTPIDEIANGLSFMATETGIEMVIQITCQLIADRLNEMPL